MNPAPAEGTTIRPAAAEARSHPHAPPAPPAPAHHTETTPAPAPLVDPGQTEELAEGVFAAPGPIKSGRLAGLTLNQAIFTLSWPVLCESFLNWLVQFVDTVVAAKMEGGQEATDAVAGGAYLLWFVGLVTMAVGVGATALISRSVGAGKRAVAHAALGQALILAFIGGVATAILLVALARPLAGVLSLSPGATDEFIKYLRAYCLGVPFTTILFAGTACARGAGDSLRPLITMVVVNVVNLAAVFSLAYSAGLGVLGIGLGTALAHAVGAVLIVAFHYRGDSGIALKTRWLRPHGVTMHRLLRLGLPNFLETLGMWVVNFTVILMVGWMSRAAVDRHDATAVGESGGMLGAHLIAIRVEAFSFLPGFAMGIAAAALAGQYMGARAPAMARAAGLRCAAAAAVFMGLCGVVFVFFGRTIVGWMSAQPAHLELVPPLLVVTGLTQVPFALAIVLRSVMHGAGDVRAVMWMTWVSQWGLRLPLAYILSGVDIPLPAFMGGGFFENPFPFDMGLTGLWVGLCLELTLRALIYGARFLHGGWLHARV